MLVLAFICFPISYKWNGSMELGICGVSKVTDPLVILIMFSIIPQVEWYISWISLVFLLRLDFHFVQDIDSFHERQFSYVSLIFDLFPILQVEWYMSWIPLVFGSTAVFGGGYLSDRLASKRGVKGRLLVLIFCCVSGLLCIFVKKKILVCYDQSLSKRRICVLVLIYLNLFSAPVGFYVFNIFAPVHIFPLNFT